MRNNVISTNRTTNNILNSANIGNIKSIFANVGFMILNALFTANITELPESPSGKSENTLTKIVSIRFSIRLLVITKQVSNSKQYIGSKKKPKNGYNIWSYSTSKISNSGIACRKYLNI